MSEQLVPYLYSVLRLVPDLDRGEAINVGLVLFSRPQRFLRLGWEIDDTRIAAFAPDVPVDLVRSQLESHALIAAADPAGGPVAALDIGERFHWLTNVSNTMIQPGPVHSGLTEDAAATFERLFAKLVQTSTEAS
ncbi:MAG: DUF3037 domain-containing protein [Thermomicrobiales bacterium]|nr:DUF3037 domain-containing protein [Thermomicrobiales bacterium]